MKHIIELDPEFQDKLIVAILPSASERYLSTALFEGIEA